MNSVLAIKRYTNKEELEEIPYLPEFNVHLNSEI
jgi:hypothetical protein